LLLTIVSGTVLPEKPVVLEIQIIIIIIIIIIIALQPFFGLGRFFSFLILYTVGRTPWTVNQPVARPLATHRTTRAQNKSA
jgi:hypothetical protein